MTAPQNNNNTTRPALIAAGYTESNGFFKCKSCGQFSIIINDVHGAKCINDKGCLDGYKESDSTGWQSIEYFFDKLKKPHLEIVKPQTVKPAAVKVEPVKQQPAPQPAKVKEPEHVQDDSDSDDYKERRGAPKISKQVLSLLESFELCKNGNRAFLLNKREAIEIGSNKYKEFVQHYFYMVKAKTISETSLKEVIAVQRTEALYNGSEKQVSVRVAVIDDNIFVDLCDSKKTIIRIDANGWQIDTESDVLFYRPPNSGSLPMPDTNGTIDYLREYVGVKESDFVLLRSIICYYFRGRVEDRGSLPILKICGAAGSAKSTKTKLIKNLIDPGKPEVRTPTKDVKNLFISAKNLFLLALDNVSHFDAEMQDALCSLATGGGYASKTNYSDDAETIFEECRAILINGISFKMRPDLQSRCIEIEMNTIDEKERLTENEVYSRAKHLRPLVLGGIFTALSNYLKVKDSINPRDYDLPRLADFGLFSVALERGNEWTEGETLKNLKDNYETGLEAIAEQNVLISKVISFIKNQREWTGTATQLLDEINKTTDEKERRSLQHWPIDGGSMGSAITRNIDVFKAANIEIVQGTGKKKREKTFVYTEGYSEVKDLIDEIPF